MALGPSFDFKLIQQLRLLVLTLLSGFSRAQTCNATSAALVNQLGTATNYQTFNTTRNSLANVTGACYSPWVQPPFYNRTACVNGVCQCDSSSSSDPANSICLPSSWHTVSKPCQNSSSIKFERIVENFVNSTKNTSAATARQIYEIIYNNLYSAYRNLDRSGMTFPKEVIDGTCFNTRHWLVS